MSSDSDARPVAVLLVVHSPGCIHCQFFLPEFQKFERGDAPLPEGVTPVALRYAALQEGLGAGAGSGFFPSTFWNAGARAAADGPAMSVMRDIDSQVVGVPHIVLISTPKEGKAVIKPYQGPRTTEDIARFVRSNVAGPKQNKKKVNAIATKKAAVAKTTKKKGAVVGKA